MKMNVELEVDGIEEDGDLNKALKEELLSKISGKIRSDSLNAIKSKAEEELNSSIQTIIENVQETIDRKALNFTADWLDTEVTLTDQWGEKKETVSIKKIIKRTFTDLLYKKVDKYGSFAEYGTQTLIYFLTGGKVKEEVELQLGDLYQDIDQKIKDAIDTNFKANIDQKIKEAAELALKIGEK